jgi:hypothetical protein
MYTDSESALVAKALTPRYGMVEFECNTMNQHHSINAAHCCPLMVGAGKADIAVPSSPCILGSTSATYACNGLRTLSK